MSEDFFNSQCAGLPTIANAAEMIKQFGLTMSAADLAEEKHTITKAFLVDQAYPLMPGVEQAIAAFVQHGLKLAVVTGANNHSVGATMRSYEFARHFSFVISADDVAASKPEPECYLLALEKLGLQPEECLAIEDTEHGLQAATQAGIPCLALPTSLSASHDFAQATAVLNNMQAAADYVRKRLQAD